MLNMWGSPLILLCFWFLSFTLSHLFEVIGVGPLENLFYLQATVGFIGIIVYLGLKYTGIFPGIISAFDRIAEICCLKFTILLATFLTKRNPEKRLLEAEIKEYQSQMAKLSQVDQFAKYSRIQRKLVLTSDKLSSIKSEEKNWRLKLTLISQGFGYIIALFLCSMILREAFIATF